MRARSRTHPYDKSLLAFLDGELSVVDSRIIKNHLKTCWRCRTSLHELEEQAEAASRLLSSAVKPDAKRTGAAKQKFLCWIKSFEAERNSNLRLKTTRPFRNWIIAVMPR
jgi:anti-sigma factor RsiW